MPLIPDGSLCAVSQPPKRGRRSEPVDKANVFSCSWRLEMAATPLS